MGRNLMYKQKTRQIVRILPTFEWMDAFLQVCERYQTLTNFYNVSECLISDSLKDGVTNRLDKKCYDLYELNNNDIGFLKHIISKHSVACQNHLYDLLNQLIVESNELMILELFNSQITVEQLRIWLKSFINSTDISFSQHLISNALLHSSTKENIKDIVVQTLFSEITNQ